MDIKPQVVRLSLTGALGIGLAVTLLGIIGGFIGQYLAPQPLLLPIQRPTTNIQQAVTVSPSLAATTRVRDSERSVVVITTLTTDTPLANGLVVTNDGLIVTTASLPEGELKAYTYDGHAISVTRLGVDSLYGLTYLHLGSGIFVPLELATSDPSVGSQLLVISRLLPAINPRAQLLSLTSYQLPDVGTPTGILRWLVSDPLPNMTSLRGSVLLNEEGKAVALLADPVAGLSLPATILQSSIDRWLTQKQELDPAARLGLSLNYTFITVGDSRRFVVQIHGVKTFSAAATAGLKINDLISAINGEPLTWEKNILSQLSAPLPLHITVVRQGQEQTLTVAAPP